MIKNIFTKLVYVVMLIISFAPKLFSEQQSNFLPVLSTYSLQVEVLPTNKMIDCHAKFQMSDHIISDSIILNLYYSLKVSSCTVNGDTCLNKRKGNQLIIYLASHKSDLLKTISVSYRGVPYESKFGVNDGGFTWQKDGNEKPVIAVLPPVSCESSWFPVAGTLLTVVQKFNLQINVPYGVSTICGGNFMSDVHEENKSNTTSWVFNSGLCFNEVAFYVADYLRTDASFVTEQGNSIHLSCYLFNGNEDQALGLIQDEKNYLNYLQNYLGMLPSKDSVIHIAETVLPQFTSTGCIAYGNMFIRNKYGVDESLFFSTAKLWTKPENGFALKNNKWMQYGLPEFALAEFIGFNNGDSIEENFMKNLLPYITHNIAIGEVPDSLPAFYNSDWKFFGAWIFYSVKQLNNNSETWNEFVKQFIHANQTALDTLKFNEAVSVLENNSIDLFKTYQQGLIPTVQYSVTKKKKSSVVQYQLIYFSGSELPVQILVSHNYHYGVTHNQYQTVLAKSGIWQQFVIAKMKPVDVHLQSNQICINIQLMD